MSCHTWIYKKAKAFTKEEKEKVLNTEIKKAESWFGFKVSKEELTNMIKKWHNDPRMKYRPQGWNGENAEQYANDLHKEFTEKLHIAQNQTFEEYLERNKDKYPTCFLRNGEYYINIEFDHPFRAYVYSDTKFTDCDTMLEWFKEHTDTIYGYYDETHNCDWIGGYTKEFEKRIRDFFELHGKENLLINFG